MKKSIVLIMSVLGLAILLSGCGNTQDKAQGKWEHQYKATKNTNHVDSITIKDDDLVLAIRAVELPPTKVENPKDNTFEFSVTDGNKQYDNKAKINEDNDELTISRKGKSDEVFKKVDNP